MDDLLLTHEERYYTNTQGTTLLLKVYYPSPPSANWPGNVHILRQWSVWNTNHNTNGNQQWLPLNAQQITEIEKALEEYDQVLVGMHTLLGPVVLVAPEDEESKDDKPKWRIQKTDNPEYYWSSKLSNWVKELDKIDLYTDDEKAAWILPLRGQWQHV